MTPALDLLTVKRANLNRPANVTPFKRHMSMILMISRTSASAADVRRIIRISRYRNQERNLTGCLMWTGSLFVQFLEGRHDLLSNAFQSMRRDQSHNSVRLLIQQRVDARSYGGLPLAFITARGIEFDLLSFLYEAHSRDDCRQLSEMLMDHWISKRSSNRATFDTWEPTFENGVKYVDKGLPQGKSAVAWD